MEKALSLIKPLRYGERFPVGKTGKASVCFTDAGHILGSAITSLTFKEDGEEKTLVFSGDLGKKVSVLMNEPALVNKADVVLMEGTYGNRCHLNQRETIDELEQILKETWEAKGIVMIPSFAVGRTQEIMFIWPCCITKADWIPGRCFLIAPWPSRSPTFMMNA